MGKTKIKSESSTTQIISSKQTHVWTIKNWRQWIGCSENVNRKAVLSSDRIYVPLVLDDKNRITITNTCWQIIAFSQRLTNNYSGQKDTHAFRLIGHNDGIANDFIRRSFNSETLEKQWLLGPAINYKFPTRSLDMASRLNNCVRYHPTKDIIIRVNVNVVTSL